ncbi:unnamed protein product, partial [marine sediment metagenome]
MDRKFIVIILVSVLLGASVGFGLSWIVVRPQLLQLRNQLDGLTSPASFVMFSSGGTTYGINGSSGEVVSSGEDAATEIQSVLDRLGNTGGKVVLRPGTYFLSTSILIRHSNVVLEGSGKSTVLFLADGVNTDILVVDAIGAGKNLSGITIRNLRLDGNRDHNPIAGHGITLNGDVS